MHELRLVYYHEFPECGPCAASNNDLCCTFAMLITADFIEKLQLGKGHLALTGCYAIYILHETKARKLYLVLYASLYQEKFFKLNKYCERFEFVIAPRIIFNYPCR